jgi:hydroxypyruvate isomerase
MPNICANLSMLFNEYDFLDKFEAASKAGFKGVEYLFPYDFDAQDIAGRLDKYNLKQVLFNLPAGNWGSGERGIACHPDRTNEFREGVDRAVAYAKALGCAQCNVLAGIVPEGVSAEQARETFVANLRYAAPMLANGGVKLLIEAINTRDIPGFFLTNTAQALSVIEEVGSDNVFFQYDIYHMQIMEGDIAKTIEANLSSIAHLQLADNPGRHEPGTGEINYGFLFEFIDKLGYDGWIGAEYIPAGNTEAGLKWMAEHGV